MSNRLGLRLPSNVFALSFTRLRTAKTTKANPGPTCSCHFCSGKVQMLPSPQPLSPLEAGHGTLRGFTWLMKELAKSSGSLGIRVLDLLVFKNGKPLLLITPAKDLSVRLSETTSLPEVFKKFTQTVKDRKDARLNPSERKSVSSGRYGREVAIVRYTTNGYTNKTLDTEPQAELGSLRLMTDKEFFEFLYERPGSNTLKTVAYVQTALRCRAGIGETITVTYQRPRNPNYSREVCDEDLLRRNNPREYCLWACRRIASLLYKHARTELYRMTAEFTVDDNDLIWFFHATDIWAKSVETSAAPTDFRVQPNFRQYVETVQGALDSHIDSKSLSPLYKKYHGLLTQKYEAVKQKVLGDSSLDRVTPTLSHWTDKAKTPSASRHRLRTAAPPPSRTWKRVHRFNL